jgi:hypothetical protein
LVIPKNSNTYGILDLHFNRRPSSNYGDYLQNFKHISEGSSKIEKTITGIKKTGLRAGFLLFGHVYRIVPIEAIPGIWIVIVVVIV